MFSKLINNCQIAYALVSLLCIRSDQYKIRTIMTIAKVRCVRGDNREQG